MAAERRYKEDEVREIFEAATSSRDSAGQAVATTDGLTLAELQDIGKEVGLAPQRIAEAASTLDVRRSLTPTRRFLGQPLSVAKTVELPREPTDREWELLVSEIRSTFDASGTMESHGSLREWSNGNLQIAIEPTPNGHRLRMRTLKSSVMGMSIMGSAAMGMSFFLALALMSKDRLADEFFLPIFFAAMGLGTVIYAALSLPGWARQREEQMDYIGQAAQALLADGDDPDE